MRDELLIERDKTHGSFKLNADISQHMKEIFRDTIAWNSLVPEHKESLDMIALKISRILSGQAQYFDHWRDVQGYAKLAEEVCPSPP